MVNINENDLDKLVMGKIRKKSQKKFIDNMMAKLRNADAQRKASNGGK